MNALRSILFTFLFYAGSVVLSIVLLPILLLPQKAIVHVVAGIYGSYISFLARYVMGLKLEIRGWEHIPAQGPFIIAAKHQSAYETLFLPFNKRLRFPAIVLKRELTWMPIWGWYPARMGLIPIDRGSGTKAMASILRGCRKAREKGRPLVIFPQGTRVAPGAKKPYKVGLAKLYRDLDLPVVPMALNTGLFWGRNSFFKKSGHVVFEFFPAIEPGLPPLKAAEKVEEILERESDRLCGL